jgi:hypothetical protein
MAVIGSPESLRSIGPSASIDERGRAVSRLQVRTVQRQRESCWGVSGWVVSSSCYHLSIPRLTRVFVEQNLASFESSEKQN